MAVSSPCVRRSCGRRSDLPVFGRTVGKRLLCLTDDLRSLDGRKQTRTEEWGLNQSQRGERRHDKNFSHFLKPPEEFLDLKKAVNVPTGQTTQQSWQC